MKLMRYNLLYIIYVFMNIKNKFKNNSVEKPYISNYIALILDNSGENLQLEIHLATLLRQCCKQFAYVNISAEI